MPAETCDAVVIGAGFYGAEIALELRRLGLERVVLADREPAIMRRASWVNQARVHAGYHYPRSPTTAERSRANFAAFVDEYADCVRPAMESVYAIASGSRVSPAQFEAFCRAVGLPCQPAPRRIAALFDPALVQDAYLTRELTFDAGRLAARLGRALEAAGVDVRCSTEARIMGPRAGGVAVALNGQEMRAAHVVNCTYAEIDRAGVAVRSRVKREVAEMLLVEPPPELVGLGITVMDGPFFSVMPFPAANPARLHSLSHVRYTPHGASEEPGAAKAPHGSNATAMLRDAARFLPCMARARPAGSIFEVKATLARNEDDDGRPILVETAEGNPRVLSVLGAKIDNVYEVRAHLRSMDWSAGA